MESCVLACYHESKLIDVVIRCYHESTALSFISLYPKAADNTSFVTVIIVDDLFFFLICTLFVFAILLSCENVILLTVVQSNIPQISLKIKEIEY